MTAVLVPDEEGKPPFFKHVLVNPTILSESVQMAALSEGEGCLSVDREVPGYVPRHEKIKLRWYDLTEMNMSNVCAIILQSLSNTR